MFIKAIPCLLAVGAFGVAPSLTYANTIQDLYNTGVDHSANVLANGAIDPHYTATMGDKSYFDGSLPPDMMAPPIPIIVASSEYGIPVSGPWLGDNATSRWIGPTVFPGSLAVLDGFYSYRTTFTLNGLDPNTASISGQWSTDNVGYRILLNGIDNTFSAGIGTGFDRWVSFSITNGFKQGTNTLDFIVENACCGYNASGLRVEMTGTAAPVPEPETYGLMIAGLGLIGFIARRRKQNA